MQFKQRIGKLKLNSSRVYLEAFVRQAAGSLAPGGLMLDAGAGHAPYRDLFRHARYESADFQQLDESQYSPEVAITYVCDLKTIPVEEKRYDLVLCTQVLEHVPEPGMVLKELYRVLKPGCALWISAPLFFSEHQAPYDYFRFTQFGFRYLLEQAGFQVERIERLEGYYGTLAYQLGMAGAGLPISPGAYGGGAAGLLAAASALVLKPLFLGLALLYSRLDVRSKNTSIGMCKNYAVLAYRPLEAA